MDSELTYRMNALRLFSDALKFIQKDTQAPPSTREKAGEPLLWGKDVFPFVIDHRPEKLARMREVAGVFARVLGQIHDDGETPYATKALIAHTLIQFAYQARQRAKPPHYEATNGEVTAARESSPPRRPQLQVYEAGDGRPREVFVFRR